MRLFVACLVAHLSFAVAVWPPHATAQQAHATEDLDLPELYRRWQQANDPEPRIVLGEQLLAREPALTAWPLGIARERARAEVSFGLGAAYVARLRGARADNLERGIAHLRSALTLFSRESDPENWANAHNNIGIAYWGRIRGDRADNQENAIAHFEAALTIFSPASEPAKWARLQNNLAVVYVNRTRGARADNLEAAIRYFQAALTVFTRTSEPGLWGQIQNNLGIAYRARIDGRRADNREQAISHLQAALTVLGRKSQEWGSAQTNLAVAYLDRIRGRPAANQEKALAHLGAALAVFNRDASPQQWAKTQTVVGNVYADRVRGGRAGNRKKAIAAYEAALSVFTREAYPRDHMLTAQRLGRVFLRARDWRRAGTAYASARDAFLLVFGQGLDEAEARTVIADAGPLFAEAAFGAVQRHETEAALVLADEGRARLMAVALRLQTLDLPAGQRQRLDELRAAARAAQRDVDDAHGTGRAAAIERLGGLRRELLGLVKDNGRGDSRGRAVLAAARAVAAAGGAVVMPIVSSLGGKMLILAKAADGRDLTVIDLPELTTARLSRLLIGPDNGPPAGWLGAYFINYLDSIELDRRWPEWLGAIDRLGPELWRLFGARLDAALERRGVAPGSRLVWLPSGWLGTLPLGLARDPARQARLGDKYEIVYAPSLEAHAAATLAAGRMAPATLAAIVNPTGDLAGTETEGAIVASHFAVDARTLLQREMATPDAVLAALKGRSYWHFASHGAFSWDDPRQSALLLHDQARLTVGRLFEATDLGRPRLVVLSACETGLFEIASNPDEFIGLPGAFIALGAAGVLGTLWPVSDAATALLIAKFYELHMEAGLSPPTALQRAQAWLRQAGSDGLKAYAEGAAAAGRLGKRQLADIERVVSPETIARSRNAAIVERIAPGAGTKAGNAANRTATRSAQRIVRPYAHPYFWAGFIYTGS